MRSGACGEVRGDRDRPGRRRASRVDGACCYRNRATRIGEQASTLTSPLHNAACLCYGDIVTTEIQRRSRRRQTGVTISSTGDSWLASLEEPSTCHSSINWSSIHSWPRPRCWRSGRLSCARVTWRIRVALIVAAGFRRPQRGGLGFFSRAASWRNRSLAAAALAAVVVLAGRHSPSLDSGRCTSKRPITPRTSSTWPTCSS